MGSYEYHPHVADVRVELLAQSLEELFLVGLKGMANMLKRDSCHPAEDAYSISVNLELKAPDPAALLVDFLSEVLTISHVDRVLFCNMENTKLAHKKLSTTVLGKYANGFDEDIKAVTYHEAKVWQTNGGLWKVSLIFDI